MEQLGDLDTKKIEIFKNPRCVSRLFSLLHNDFPFFKYYQEVIVILKYYQKILILKINKKWKVTNMKN